MPRIPTYLAAAALASGIGLEPLASPKPGNTHRLREKPDARLRDFAAAGIAAASILHSLMSRGETRIGRYLYALSIYTARIHRGGNTCLGTSMLLAPLASAMVLAGMRVEDVEDLCRAASLRAREAGVEDALFFYRALRDLRPSYLDPGYSRLPSVLDPSHEEEVRRRGVTLRDILEEASAWDNVSRNVLHGYREALEAYRVLSGSWDKPEWEPRVVEAYLELLSARPDGLVVAKQGLEAAVSVMAMADKALSLGGPWSQRGMRYIRFMDTLLRRRGINPGSTADIVALGISLVVLRRAADLVEAGVLPDMP